MRFIKILLLCLFILSSCNYDNPAFRFSNFYGTPAETIARAIEKNDVKAIREEVLKKEVNVNFEDDKYEVSLLVLALVNNKKEAFEELLKLGADPNIENCYCVGPLNSAIRYNHNCDLYFVKRLLDQGAEITPRFFNSCNFFAFDPINETILYYNDENNIQCGLEILEVLTTKLDDINLLHHYNNPDEYRANVVYKCISTTKNLSALKFLIIELKYNVPEEIFINGTVLQNYEGYKSLVEILNSREFSFMDTDNFREKAKNDILEYLANNKNQVVPNLDLGANQKY